MGLCQIMDKCQNIFKVWDSLADAYQAKFMDLDLYNDSYNTFCSLLSSPGSKILEIGSGPGNISKYLLSVRSDFQIKGIDASSRMVDLAQQNNPGAEFEIMDCRNISAQGLKVLAGLNIRVLVHP